MVESLGGRYYTACDVGTFVQDMDVIAKETRFATGRSPEHGGAGDSAVLTAYGVFQAMRAAAQHTWGRPTLAGRRVARRGRRQGRPPPRGAPARGRRHRRRQSDVNEAARRAASPPLAAGAVATVAELPTLDVDVYAPCALGGSLSDDLVPALQATVVCGAANNQLAHPGIEKELADRGVLYAPDYVANAGGLIQVADEARTRLPLRARQGEGRADLRHDAADLPAGRRRGRAPGRRRGPPRRAPDGRRRAGSARLLLP